MGVLVPRGAGDRGRVDGADEASAGALLLLLLLVQLTPTAVVDAEDEIEVLVHKKIGVMSGRCDDSERKNGVRGRAQGC